MSYDYVPGAGDDEESWAAGLTPAMFWSHKQVSALACWWAVPPKTRASSSTVSLLPWPRSSGWPPWRLQELCQASPMEAVPCVTQLLGTQAAQKVQPLHQGNALRQTATAADAAQHSSSAVEAAGQSAATAGTSQEIDSSEHAANAPHISNQQAAHSTQNSCAAQHSRPGSAVTSAAAGIHAASHHSPSPHQQAVPAKQSAPAQDEHGLPGPAPAMPASDRLRDRHHLLPAGVRLGLASDAAVREPALDGHPVPGACWLGQTSLAVGCSQTVSPQAAAEAGAAVLDCSLQQSAAWSELAGPAYEACGLDAAGRPVCASSSKVCSPGEEFCSQQACNIRTAAEQAPGRAACQQCYVQQQPSRQQACFLSSDGLHAAQPLPPGPAYLHLPIISNKTDKHSLEEKLGPALEFAQQQLGVGRRLLILCESGESAQQLLPAAPCLYCAGFRAGYCLKKDLEPCCANAS